MKVHEKCQRRALRVLRLNEGLSATLGGRGVAEFGANGVGVAEVTDKGASVAACSTNNDWLRVFICFTLRYSHACN